MDELLVERVLLAVEQIPAGRVASYGLIASLVGTGPRQVGRIMRDYGSFVTWWRVTSRDGDVGGTLLDSARPHWAAEGIRIKANGLGCRYDEYGVDEAEFAAAYRRAALGGLGLGDNPHSGGNPPLGGNPPSGGDPQPDGDPQPGGDPQPDGNPQPGGIA